VSTVWTGLGWIAGLAIAVYASEKLVHFLTDLGAHIHMPPGLLGLTVALGADAPEVASALIAMAHGSPDVGLGVILGSNIYNLAGLLGLSALAAGRLATTPSRLIVDGGTNFLLTLGLVGLVLLSGFHVLLGVILLLVLLAKVIVVSDSRGRLLRYVPAQMQWILRSAESDQPTPPARPARPLPGTLALVLLSVAFIVAGSYLLVTTSLALGSTVGLSSGILGTVVLAIATSVPNTWAAVSLARRGFGAAAVATTFSSNSINAALGAGLPSLVVALHVSPMARTFDAPWLLGMTALALVFCATRWSVTVPEGAALMAAYVAFLALYLVAFR